MSSFPRGTKYAGTDRNQINRPDLSSVSNSCDTFRSAVWRHGLGSKGFILENLLSVQVCKYTPISSFWIWDAYLSEALGLATVWQERPKWMFFFLEGITGPGIWNHTPHSNPGFHIFSPWDPKPVNYIRPKFSSADRSSDRSFIMLFGSKISIWPFSIVSCFSTEAPHLFIDLVHVFLEAHIYKSC